MTNTVISEGTLRSADLIPAFWDAVPPARQSEILSGEYALDILDATENEEYNYDSEAAKELLDYLFDVLDDCASDGTYFGSHEGDGALFGFWSAA